MFKEIFELIKMLFQNKPSRVITTRHLKLKQMHHFPIKGYRHMMWCGTIISRDTNKEVLDRFTHSYYGKRSYTHECIHALQAETEHGDNWFRFYINYLWHWLKNNPFTHPSSSAYYTNRYEVEAYAQEEHPEYLYRYNRDNLRGKYTIKNAKKKYKELGGPLEWKGYVKSL